MGRRNHDDKDSLAGCFVDYVQLDLKRNGINRADVFATRIRNVSILND